MNTTLDYCYKFVYYKLDQFIPENVIAYITLAVKILFSLILRYIDLTKSFFDRL